MAMGAGRESQGIVTLDVQAVPVCRNVVLWQVSVSMPDMRACCLNLLQSGGATVIVVVVVVVGRSHITVPFWRAAAQDGRRVMAIAAMRDFLRAQSVGMLERHVEVQLAAGRKRGDPGETVLVAKCCGYPQTL